MEKEKTVGRINWSGFMFMTDIKKTRNIIISAFYVFNKSVFNWVLSIKLSSFMHIL